jgi:hypothetical protein
VKSDKSSSRESLFSQVLTPNYPRRYGPAWSSPSIAGFVKIPPSRILLTIIADGGGTRVLSVLYTLREVMANVVPGNAGQVRPCEYFDLIAGSGLSGLCALVFIRFVSLQV